MDVKQLFLAIGVAMLVISMPGSAQPHVNVDSLFGAAQDMARSGQRENARDLCRKVLQHSPDYTDVRVYLGRLYAWDKQYQEAVEELRLALRKDPDERTALSALVDVKYWSGETTNALKICNYALAIYPTDTELLVKKAKLQLKLERHKDARATVMKVLYIDPSNFEAYDLLERVKAAPRLNKISFKYENDYFDRAPRDYGPWHLAALRYTRRTAIGTVVARLNYAHRKFGGSPRSGYQYELDAYPKIRPGMYVYLNAGYSKDAVFPETRFGGELYRSMGNGFEMSAGFRQLNFQSTHITIYTGSFGKYVKNYWISFRPYITPKDAGTSFSGNLMVRYYFGDAENYLHFSIGSGSSPLEVSTQEELQRLNSQKAGFYWQKPLTRTLAIQFGVDYEYEEWALNTFGDRYGFSIDLEKAF